MALPMTSSNPLAALLARLGGGGAPGPGGPGGPPLLPGGPGLPGPPPDLAPPPGLPGPGPGPDTMSLGKLALAAMDQLAPRQPSGVLGMERVRQALSMAERLISLVLPSVASLNPELNKALYQIGRQLSDAQLRLDKTGQAEVGPPPPLFTGLRTGIPGGQL